MRRKESMTRRAVYAVSGVSILVAVLVIGLVFVLFRLLRGDVIRFTDQAEKYGQWDLPEQYSQLAVFPPEIPGSATQVKYYYQYENGFNRPMCQIYLYCRLSQEEYAAEESRLAGLFYDSPRDGRKTVRLDEKSFPCPAYVANEGYDFCYEYAMMKADERSVTYVYVMNTLESDIGFDRSSLPDYFMEGFTELSEKGLDRYTMYERYRNNE